MPHQGIAPPSDFDATIRLAGLDAEKTVIMPSWQKLRAEAVTGGLVRPALPGLDCPPADRRPRHRGDTFAVRIARGLTLAVVLLWCGIAAVCAVAFWASIP